MKKEPSSTVDIVTAGIEEMIRTGKLLPGNRFPSERALAEMFNVSRNTVREVLHHFEAIGIAAIKRGSGCYLIYDPNVFQKMFNERQILEKYNWMEMVQTRRVLECGIVKLAARTATREDKIQLREMFEDLIESSHYANNPKGLKRRIEKDYEFHHSLARVSGNSMLIELHAALRDVILSAVEVWETSPNFISQTDEHHQKILNAVVSNDEEAAERATEEHLKYMEYLIELSKEKR